MKIALLAPLEEPVPPAKYGGTELVVANLAKGLLRRGHQVHLFASGNSLTNARLHAPFPSGIREMAPRPEDSKLREAYKYMGIAYYLEELQREGFDVLHNHLGWRLLPFASQMSHPLVTTLHGPLTDTYAGEIFTRYAQLPFVSISNSQRRPLPNLNYAATVYNGIDTDRFPVGTGDGGYLAFLGRMSPEKGPLQAIKAAKASGKRLVMAAKVDAVDRDYFSREIEPLIDGDQIKFIGEVDHAGKVALLKEAEALLALIQWEEPFGLFMAEAMACGTPVVAIGRGSVPELVADGETGYIVGPSEEEAVTAIARLSEIDRSRCRVRVEELFSLDAMVRGYEEVYRSLMARPAPAPAPAGRPVRIPARAATD